VDLEDADEEVQTVAAIKWVDLENADEAVKIWAMERRLAKLALQ
jgi:hypothetical protein